MTTTVDEALASKVLEVVDAGLCHGLGTPEPGKMCIEAAVCYAMGLPHSDKPTCVSNAVRALKIQLNDKNWSSDMARAKGLRRLAIAQLGSMGTVDDVEFAKRVNIVVIKYMVPIALRAAAIVNKDERYVTALNEAANNCEDNPTQEMLNKAREVAYAAAYDTLAIAHTHHSAYAAANVAYSATTAATYAANAVYPSNVAAYAVEAAEAATAKTQKDKILSDFAEHIVQVLIEMDSPGCEFLHLTA